MHDGALLVLPERIEPIRDPSKLEVLCSLSPLPLTRVSCAILGFAYGRGIIWPGCEEEATHAARNLMVRKQVSEARRSVRSCSSLLHCGSAIVDALELLLRRFPSISKITMRYHRPYVVLRERNDLQFPRYLREPRDPRVTLQGP